MSMLKKFKFSDTENMIFSRPALIKLLIPLFLQQILNITVGTVNSVMVSKAGDAVVSAVSLVNSLDGTLMLFFTSLAAGGSVVMAQVFGTKKNSDISETSKQLLYTVTTAALILCVAVLCFGTSLLKMFFGEVEADVMASAEIYFTIISLSFPLLAISEAVAACFRAAGITVITLMSSIAVNIVNIAGNAVFVIALDMGAKGSAISTLIARAVGSAIMLAMILNKKYPGHIEKIFSYKPDFKIFKRILGIGVPNATEDMLLQLGRLMTQALISSLGTVAMTANSVANTIVSYQYSVNGAFSAAMIIAVGRCIGARNAYQAKYYSRILLCLNYLMLGSVAAATVIFMRPLLSMYDISASALDTAAVLIALHALTAALIYPLGFLLPSTFRAASDVKFTLVVSMLTMWGLRVGFAYFMALDTVSVFGLFTLPGLGMGIVGVWCAMFLDWVVRSTLYLIRYISGRWLRAAKLSDTV